MQDRQFVSQAADSTVLVDPEAFDSSEQQFAASIEEGPTERHSAPKFIPESLTSRSERSRSDQPPPADEQFLDTTREGSYSDVSPCPQTAGDDLKSYADLITAAALYEGEEETEDQPQWRQEVAARVHNYQSRRRRRPPRYPSLNLKFDPPVYSRSESSRPPAPPRAFANCQAAPGRADLATATAQSMPASRASVAEAPPLPLDPTNVIEFPRPQPPPSPRPAELAEPVLDKPRILDAPEDVPQQASLGGIILEAEEPAPAPALEVPLQVAPLPARLTAAAIDGGMVFVAAIVFLLVGNKISPVGLPPRSLLVLSAVLASVLWAIFQYLFLVYTGATPGLELAKLRVSRFDAAFPARNDRRWRALAMALSALSLGLGFLWCLLDEDTLCWHDRITCTYLTTTGTSVIPARILAVMKRVECFLHSRVEGGANPGQQ
jgi:uncharacterized RDD family membrane protein YckC